ncbi:MAG: hypothetical protein CBC02_009815 [Flavobacteriaceae bacterium TMED42]|nr:MAG: hypothetical protein CBC02_009815 [Flavobacteriaceae bacterium TMED42]|tara:strand:+ start:590 stop:1201 length:612 start_codon:yes stop_codon:yes gene_type:complete
MINHTKKFIFVHIPKTAGSTIEAVFARLFSVKLHEYIKWNNELNHWDQHLTLSEIKDTKVTSNAFTEYFKFSIVRNPWDRIISELAWRFGVRFLEGSITIQDFLSMKFKTKNRIDPERHLIPQYEFLYDKKGSLICDFIGKTENLQEDFNTICDKIGIPKQKLPRKNKSKHKHYTEYYDKETKQIVAEKYAKDIEYFGYEFGE